MGPIRSLSLISGPDEVIVLYWAMLLGFCTCFIFGRAPHTKESLSNFFKIMGPGKGGTMVWYRVTRHPRVFRRLTGCQRTPGFWGVTI